MTKITIRGRDHEGNEVSEDLEIPEDGSTVISENSYSGNLPREVVFDYETAPYEVNISLESESELDAGYDNAKDKARHINKEIQSILDKHEVELIADTHFGIPIVVMQVDGFDIPVVELANRLIKEDGL